MAYSIGRLNDSLVDGFERERCNPLLALERLDVRLRAPFDCQQQIGGGESCLHRFDEIVGPAVAWRALRPAFPTQASGRSPA